MSSPPPDNILTDPLSELTAVLKAHAFGLHPSSAVLEDTCFPRTEADRAAVAKAARTESNPPGRVAGRARLVLLNDEGEAVVELSEKGYTIIESSRTVEHAVFESLDSLLIALSPSYVEKMQSELMKRFEGASTQRRYHEDAEEVAWVD